MTKYNVYLYTDMDSSDKTKIFADIQKKKFKIAKFHSEWK